MRRLESAEASWAEEEFGQADLADARRTARLVRMAARVAQRPAGKVSEVFIQASELQGAYDFLEGGRVDPKILVDTLGATTMRRGAEADFLFVPVDGSSLALADDGPCKKFGSVGTVARGGRGLKVITALGVTPDGAPLGLAAQVWWARPQPQKLKRNDRHKRNRKRQAEEKETRYWLQAINESCLLAEPAGTKLWFQLDREGDNKDILLTLHQAAQSGHRFTVRSSWNRLLESTGKDKQYLRHLLAQQASIGEYIFQVSGGHKRQARQARIAVRSVRTVLRLRDRYREKEWKLEVTAVWAREEGTTPQGEKPINWLLLTNVPADRFEAAHNIVLGYMQRWRIEEFHKTWKTGACNVEQTQLRAQPAVVLWATILAAVAIRIERLKRLARTTPDEPADIALTNDEIRVLKVYKRETKKRTELIPTTMPTIAQAVLWIAQMGGYMDQSSGAPPGAITIGRGLERLRHAVILLRGIEAELRNEKK